MDCAVGLLLSGFQSNFESTVGDLVLLCFVYLLTSICVGVDHVSDGGTPGWTVLRELTRNVRPTLSPSCVAEESQSREGLQVCLDRGCPRLQLVSSSSSAFLERALPVFL